MIKKGIKKMTMNRELKGWWGRVVYNGGEQKNYNYMINGDKLVIEEIKFINEDKW